MNLFPKYAATDGEGIHIDAISVRDSVDIANAYKKKYGVTLYPVKRRPFSKIWRFAGRTCCPCYRQGSDVAINL